MLKAVHTLWFNYSSMRGPCCLRTPACFPYESRFNNMTRFSRPPLRVLNAENTHCLLMDIPGGSRPVTVTAYTPGLKLPIRESGRQEKGNKHFLRIKWHLYSLDDWILVKSTIPTIILEAIVKLHKLWCLRKSVIDLAQALALASRHFQWVHNMKTTRFVRAKLNTKGSSQCTVIQ